jgi:hypothetical protein
MQVWAETLDLMRSNGKLMHVFSKHVATMEVETYR